ncbi:MAG: hypothetical protein ACRDVP_10820 [Acidimicrobiales bacterium]
MTERRRLVTGVEAFQEILHRCCAIGRGDAIGPAYDVLRNTVEAVLLVEEPDVIEAKNLAVTYQWLSARHALHVAVMANRDLHQIFSFDRGPVRVAGQGCG